MRPFIINDDIKQQFSELIKHAEKNPVSMDRLLDQMLEHKGPIGNEEGYSLKLPFGYRVVYSIEKQPLGDVRHLSISVDADDKFPNPISVKEAMKLLEFKKELEESHVKIEQTSEKRGAINILELIEK